MIQSGLYSAGPRSKSKPAPLRKPRLIFVLNAKFNKRMVLAFLKVKQAADRRRKGSVLPRSAQHEISQHCERMLDKENREVEVSESAMSSRVYEEYPSLSLSGYSSTKAGQSRSLIVSHPGWASVDQSRSSLLDIHIREEDEDETPSPAAEIAKLRAELRAGLQQRLRMLQEHDCVENSLKQSQRVCAQLESRVERQELRLKQLEQEKNKLISDLELKENANKETEARVGWSCTQCEGNRELAANYRTLNENLMRMGKEETRQSKRKDSQIESLGLKMKEISSSSSQKLQALKQRMFQLTQEAAHREGLIGHLQTLVKQSLQKYNSLAASSKQILDTLHQSGDSVSLSSLRAENQYLKCCLYKCQSENALLELKAGESLETRLRRASEYAESDSCLLSLAEGRLSGGLAAAVRRELLGEQTLPKSEGDSRTQQFLGLSSIIQM